MTARRSTRLIAVGAAALVVGVGMAALAVRGAGGAAAATPSATSAAAAPAPAPAAAAPADPAPRIPASVTVPDGHEAVALQLPYDAGVAGLPTSGDHVNVYGVFKAGDPATTSADEAVTAPQPYVEAVLAGVEVLAISGPDVEAGGGTPTVVLALTPDQTLRAILLQTAERVWLTLTPPEGTAPAEAGLEHAAVTR